MRSVSALEVRAKFGQVLDGAAAGERIVIERAGRPVAALVPLADLDLLDPERIRERRRAGVQELARLGEEARRRLGTLDAAALVRRDRDRGHRP